MRIYRWKSYLDQIESQGVPTEQRGKQLDRDLMEKVKPYRHRLSAAEYKLICRSNV